LRDGIVHLQKKTENLLYALSFLIFLWLINRRQGGKSQMKKGDKAVTLCSVILLLIFIVLPLAGIASAEPIIIDTEKGVPGFRTEPARDLPANWQYVHDHPDTSADGWFDTYASLS
jgi:hypothetical protein